jgi:hypothetical protein
MKSGGRIAGRLFCTGISITHLIGSKFAHSCACYRVSMNASERLHAAHQAKLEGRYADALRDLAWYHDHALDEQPSLYAVRLSFGLGHWIDLGKVYPAAMLALEAVRDRKTQALLRGEGDRALFHDVTAINEGLGSTRAIYDLYLALAERMPGLAKQCASLALPAIVAARDYRLANRIRPDPETLVRKEAAQVEADVNRIRHRPFSPAPRRRVLIGLYADSVRLQRDITAGIGDRAGARRLESLALGLIRNPRLREAVRVELARPHRSDPPASRKWKNRMKRGR